MEEGAFTRQNAAELPPPPPASDPASQADDAGGQGKQQQIPHETHHVTDAPPYWARHQRTVSYQSITQRRRSGGPISLEDHSEEDHVQAQSCWAESASIDEYLIVSGGSTGIGAYVVWHCTVKTLHGGDLCLRKRYVAVLTNNAFIHCPRSPIGLQTDRLRYAEPSIDIPSLTNCARIWSALSLMLKR